MYAHSVEAKHIVAQNEKLHEETKELRKSLVNTENERDQFENELDGREKQVTYLRGLLKNFVAIKEGHGQIQTQQKNEILSMKSITERNEAYIRRHEYASTANFLVISFCFLADKLDYLDHSMFLVSWFLILGMTTYYFKRYRTTLNRSVTHYQKQISKNRKMKQKMIEELKDTIRACDFLNEYVDSI
jgi:predicted ribosome quality control (RQC) complex YloA/Tae2 family protein